MKRCTKLFWCLLLLVLGVIGSHSSGIVNDKPFLSFTNEDSNIGVELGFSIPLLKVPLEGVKRPENAGHILSAPIEVNIPALAVAATMFVATTAFVPKVFQLLLPYLRPPSTTGEYWRRDNTSTISEHWKSILDLENNPESNDIPDPLGFSATSPRPRSGSRKLAKRFPKLYRLQPTCGTFCNATSATLPRPAKKVPKTEIDPK